MLAIPLVLVLVTATPAPTAAAAPKPSDAAKSPALEKIEAAVLRKEWKEVARLSAELSAREPKNADGAYWQGVAALNLGQLDVAIEQLTRSLTLEERTKGHFNLGMALAMRGEVEKALPHFQRSVAMSPKYEPGWQAVAQAQLQLGDALTAGESVLRALELTPGDPELLSLGLRIADAQRSKRFPPEALRHHERGAIYAESGDAAQAKSEFAQALALAPEFADCHYNLGVIARREGDLAEGGARVPHRGLELPPDRGAAPRRCAEQPRGPAALEGEGRRRGAHARRGRDRHPRRAPELPRHPGPSLRRGRRRGLRPGVVREAARRAPADPGRGPRARRGAAQGSLGEER